MNKKAASAISVIGGADGPTSVFIAGKRKKSFQQRFRKMEYAVRKRFVTKRIKANPHSMEEVIDFLKSEGYRELSSDTKEYREEYCSMRAAFLLMYEPQLLGEMAEKPKLEENSTEAAKLYMEQMEKRQKAAENISKDLFDIDMYILEKRAGADSYKVILERKYGYIGGSAAGNGKAFNQLFRKVYQYYGVTQKDIENRTKRYEDLVRVLASKHSDK